MAISAFIYEKKAANRCLLFSITSDFLHVKDQYPHQNHPRFSNDALFINRRNAVINRKRSRPPKLGVIPALEDGFFRSILVGF